MNSQQVLSLVLLLTPEGPYFRLMNSWQIGRRQHSLARRLQIAMTDPALLAHICQSHAEARQPLPPFRWPVGVTRAYDSFLDPKRADKNLAMAQKLQRQESHFERSIIRGPLMCPEATDEQVAQVFQLEPEVVTLVELLWWNVRARAGPFWPHFRRRGMQKGIQWHLQKFDSAGCFHQVECDALSVSEK